jgi:hypothetical protein
MKIVVRIELITDWGDANTIEVGRTSTGQAKHSIPNL